MTLQVGDTNTTVKFAMIRPCAVQSHMAFLTEKQIDARLEPVSRAIPFPDGETHTFTMMQVYWDSADYVQDRRPHWPSLVQQAIDMSEKHGVDLDSALAAVATRSHEWLKLSEDKSLDVQPGVCPLMHKISHPFSHISGIDARNRRT